MNIAILGYGAVGKSLTNVLCASNNKLSVFSSKKYLEKNNKHLISQFPIENFSKDLNTQDIIFLTARGFVTKINWYELTASQLEKWGVQYHELYLTKPHADIYIDDKGLKDSEFFLN